MGSRRLYTSALIFALILAPLAAITISAPQASGQTIVTGDISGVVTDATNAVIVGATVTLTSDADASVRTTTAGTDGAFRFTMLRPGEYSIKVSSTGLVGAAAHVTVNTGKATAVIITVKPSAVSTEVLVDSSSQPLLQTEDANITTSLDSRSIEQLPVPGGDISTLAFTAPGINLSTGAGYGGFVAFGLPATSNLYTMNGNDIMDPYLNLNNSGASNLTLGANEIADVAIVNNGYDAQYGRYPGTQINYTTKSGGNQFHGNLQYFWNGRVMNANDWINKNGGGKRPFANSNQWAGSVGGPIWKNKVFFFFDQEGMRYVLPGGGGLVKIPTTQFLSDVVANVSVVNPSETNFYKTIQTLYNGASGAANATTMTTANCGKMEGVTLNGHLYGVGNSSCTRTFYSAVNNLNTEALWNARVDQVLGNKDHLFYRAHHDWGVQATGTDPINSAFNANSVQPEWEGQVTETHMFSSTLANNLIISGMYYRALFGPSDFAASTKVFPTTLIFTSSFANLGGTNQNYPSGRNVQQYQVVDDLSWQHGRHSVKVGLNYRWDKISDYTSQVNKNGSITFKNLFDFANGQVTSADTVSQAFPTVGPMPEIDPTFGIYAQDEWAVTDRLKLVLSGRIDHNGNFWCPKNCFSTLISNFPEIAHDATIPYNKTILNKQAHPFQSTDMFVMQPRFGFAYAPMGQTGKLNIRGGAGLFSDAPPGTLARRFLSNAPNVASFSYAGNGLVDPSLTSGSAFNFLSASAAAFQTGFAQGLTLAQIQTNVAAKGSKYSAPTYYTAVNHFRTPQTAEWNLEVQYQISRADVVDFNYVGNKSWNTILISNLDNAYSADGFGGLPTSAPDARFGRIVEYTNKGRANYNGLTTSIRHQARFGLSLTANYTYSHALDMASNGGLEYFNASNGYLPVLEQMTPNGGANLNYGNADYDIRNSSSVQYVWNVPAKSSNALLKPIVEGWGVSGNLFYRGGYPVTIVNTDIAVSNNATNAGSGFLAALVSGGDNTCAVKPDVADPTTGVCYQKNSFASAADLSAYKYGFGNIARNSFSGPHYFNADLQLNKETRIAEKHTVKIGANFFNVLNHANFAPPIPDASAPDFGALESTVTPPSSPYGSFMGSAVSGRVIQLLASYRF